MSRQSEEDLEDREERDEEDQDEEILERWTNDPAKKEKLLRKLGLDDDVNDRTLSGKKGGVNREATPSGTNMGNPWPPFPPSACPPFWWPHGPWACANDQGLPVQHQQCTNAPSTSASAQATTSYKGKKRARVVEEEEEDRLELLDEEEALELVEFDPSVNPKDAWELPKQMDDFMKKHFNKSLTEAERAAILKDFPLPDCEVLTVPKLDDQIKEQLRSRGKDPHFGSERTLYKIQESMLEVAAPLTCLWADLLNKEAEVTIEDTLLLVQRSLVLLGSASNQISAERRRVAWGKINPKLKSLANEEYAKRETNLFGPGFLEKASKRIEAEKTMSKVAPAPPANKKFKYARDKSDLRSFLAKGAPVRYGDRHIQRQQPYFPYPKNFRSKRYFKPQRKNQEQDQNKSQRRPQNN